jgi:hypothetical protein
MSAIGFRPRMPQELDHPLSLTCPITRRGCPTLPTCFAGGWALATSTSPIRSRLGAAVAIASGQVTVNFETSSGSSGTGGTLTDDVPGSIFSLCYDFHLGQGIKSGPCSLSAYSTGDNGNVFQVLNNTDPTRSAVFAYDSLNRITQANTVNTTSANCWGEAYTIDAWGNLHRTRPCKKRKSGAPSLIMVIQKKPNGWATRPS